MGVPAGDKHEANGVAWYFSGDWSWGFALAGDEVNRTECDTAEDHSKLRLCRHTIGTQLDNGWRCGADTSLDDSFEFERWVFAADGRGGKNDMAPQTG
ncbi:hypothetical protein [Nannocystis pusilla]|uniref:hypothetical protein n=1 Tax=Nannocystis pusilla TaxID=889268 RepID=UPI003DA20254